MRVGFIGLGQMGSGMAACLLKAGHELSVYNRTAGKSEPLVRLGAKAPGSIAAVSRGDALITMLANDPAVEHAVFGDSGVLKSLPGNAVHISCSTISVALSKRLAEAHERAGQHFLAAPVFGRPDAAAAGKLIVAVAGKPGIIEACMPLFAAIGQRTFVMSERPEAANLVKLGGNFLIAAVIEALGEAMALVGKGGVDRQAYLELLTSTLFNSPVYKIYGKLIVDGKFEPAGFAALLGQKDIHLALAAADALQVPMPLAGLIRDRFLTLLALGGETLDWSAIGALAARDAGISSSLDSR